MAKVAAEIRGANHAQHNNKDDHNANVNTANGYNSLSIQI